MKLRLRLTREISNFVLTACVAVMTYYILTPQRREKRITFFSLVETRSLFIAFHRKSRDLPPQLDLLEHVGKWSWSV
jgi:hypothetical protein